MANSATELVIRSEAEAWDALEKTVHVGRVNGVPNCDDVDKELLAFLRDLMTVDAGGQQAINADGLIGDKVRMLAVESK